MPGAGIFAFSTFTGLGSGAGQQEVAGPDGRFRLRVAGAAASLSLAVMAPGYAFHLESTALVDGRGLEVHLEESGGELLLDAGSTGPAPVLVKDGTFVPLQILAIWARMNGAPRESPGRITIPEMEAGAYSLCRGATAISSLRQGEAAPAASCASGVLTSRGRLTLTAPSLPPTPPQPGK